MRNWDRRDVMKSTAKKYEPEETYQGKEVFCKCFKGDIFTVGTRQDMIRVQRGKEDFYSLPPCQRFALEKHKQPLLFHEIENDETFTPLVYHPFRWCSIRSNVVNIFESSYSIPGFLPEEKQEEMYLFIIEPKFSDHIYVAEMAILNYPLRRKSDYKLHTSTYQELARSLRPINLYFDYYEKPVILIQRRLMFDEVRYVKSIKNYTPS